MTEHNVQRVAIAGFGAIGKVVAEHLDRGIDGLSLAAVAARDTKRAEAAMAGFAHPAPVLPLARLGEFADIVVECAPAALLREIAEPALAAGRTVIVLSCGALVDNFDLVDLARRQGGRILVPTGALLALDAVQAAATFTFAGKPRAASRAVPLKTRFASLSPSTEMPFWTRYGAPASPFGGFRVIM